MKLAALERWLATHGRCKVFVTADAFCLTGYLTRLRRAGDTALADLGAFVRIARDDGSLTEALFGAAPLVLDQRMLLTRRLRTHRRHVADWPIPTAYWTKAIAL